MSHEIYLISDTHFGHTNTWALFKQNDGVTPLRPFSSTEEMDEKMIDNWNRTVRIQDHVYHCGDVLINKKYFHLLGRLQGHKRLVMGNHDIYEYGKYADYFEKIMACRVFSDMILSHIPLRENQITTRFGVNIHGHLHGNMINDPRYLSVCVEQTNYTPLHIDEVRDRVKKNKESFEKSGRCINWMHNRPWQKSDDGPEHGKGNYGAS